MKRFLIGSTRSVTQCTSADRSMLRPRTRLLAASILSLSSSAILLAQTSELDCSPTFNGVPVAATFLMHQAMPLFDTQFPGLEISPVFVKPSITSRNQKSTTWLTDNETSEDIESHFEYSEDGGAVTAALYPTSCETVVPVFERLAQVEEARLGAAGIRKRPVGLLKMRGKCKLGCAAVELVELK
ncbi:hypothetical protein HK096_001349, partial [Nowakowskiella sp. JEL0078]